MIDSIKKEHSDMVICFNYNVIESDISNCENRFELFKSSKRDYGVFSIKSSDYDYYDESSHWTVWGVLYDRKLIQNLKFKDDLYVAEDTYFLSESIKMSKKITFIDECLLYYVVLKDSASHGFYDKKKHTELEAWRRICELYSDRPEQLKTIRGKFADICLKNMKMYQCSKCNTYDLWLELKREYKFNVKFAISLDLKKKKIKNLIKHFITYLSPGIIIKLYIKFDK